MTDMITMEFDYGDLAAEKVLECETAFQTACAIENQATRMIGEQFAKAKENLKFLRNGNGWQEWCKAKLQISITQAHHYINEFENGESIKNLYTFGKSARFLLTAPTMPQEVRDQASALAEAGEDVSVKTIKKLKADYEANQAELEAEKRRSMEWRDQWKEKRDLAEKALGDLAAVADEKGQLQMHVAALERRIDAFDKEPKPEPVKIEVPPADYDSIKAKAAAAEKELEKLKKEQAKLVKDQVASKLQGYQSEVEQMERKKALMQVQVDRMKAYLESLDSEAKRLEAHNDVIEKTRLELIGLAAFLSDLDPINDDGTLKKWAALADMLRNGAAAIECFCGNNDHNHKTNLKAI